MDNEPTVTAQEPDEDQTPPEGYVPQVDLRPDQKPVLVERDGVTVDDIEAEIEDVDPDDGEAAEGDDAAEDGMPGDD